MYLVATRDQDGIESSFPVLTRSLEHQTDPTLQGLLFFVMGITCFFKNNYEEARMHLEKIAGLPLAEKSDLHGIANMGLGLTYRSLGQLDEAVARLSASAESINQDGPFRLFIAYCHHQLGEIHVTIGEYENAIQHFTNDYTLAKEYHDSLASFRYHMGLGSCYLKMKEYEKGKSHYLQALELKDLLPPIVAIIENELGVLHLKMNDYGQAETYLTNSIAYRESHNLEDAACTGMITLAEVYLLQERNSEAIPLLNRCLTLVEKYHTQWKKITVLSLLARAYSHVKNYEEAVRYYEQYHTLYDKIKGEQERNIFKFKNAQIERQKKIISEKHAQLAATLEEIKRLKVDRKAAFFSWSTIIILVVISELLLDPFIENYSYNNLISLLVKVMIALLFKPLDGLYEKILWERAIKKS